ncbi:MAG: hypothetical protein ISS16_05290 [Ignavibacteria bacterium]|nr:hypothetical protein [Ignavibacteria bacterium]
MNARKHYTENNNIEPPYGTSPDSPITKFIEKKGEGLHHCSFEVSDIGNSLRKIKED